jgi:hypothetical protein
LERYIEINGYENLNIEFPAEFELKLKTFDNRGFQYTDGELIIEKNGESLKLDYEGSESTASVPPGNYKLEVFKDGELVGSRKLSVYSDYRLDIITNYQPIFPLMIIIVFICLIVASFFISYLK